jgi:hypothetical protein
MFLTFGAVSAGVAGTTVAASLTRVEGAAGGGAGGQAGGQGRLSILAARPLPPLAADARPLHAHALPGAAGVRAVHCDIKMTCSFALSGPLVQSNTGTVYKKANFSRTQSYNVGTSVGNPDLDPHVFGVSRIRILFHKSVDQTEIMLVKLNFKTKFIFKAED